MKKMVFGLFLALATGLLVSPILAADPSQIPRTLSAADQAFLSSIATPLVPTLAAKRPSVGQKALCSAAASCGNGTQVSCTGNNSTTSCSSADRNCSIGERGHVTCDGVTKWCATPCPVDCAQLESNCAFRCDPCNYSFTCDPATGSSSCRCILKTCPI